MQDDPVIALATKFGPILKAAFPNEHSVTRFQVANALAEAAHPLPEQPQEGVSVETAAAFADQVSEQHRQRANSAEARIAAALAMMPADGEGWQEYALRMRMALTGEAHSPMSELQRMGEGWQPIETMPLWEVGVVSNGEEACVSQKAQGDFHEGDEHYFAVDPEDALEWEPTHWMPLPSESKL